MSRLRRSAPWAATAALLSAAAPALGDPSVWVQAAQPERRREAALVREVERRLEQSHRLDSASSLSATSRAQSVREAWQLLTARRAGQSRSPYLRHLRARVLYALYDTEGDAAHLRQAVAELRVVARTATTVTARAEAYNDLAMSYARLGRHAEEVAAYAEALRVEPHAESQAILLANQAEGYLALGDVSAAMAGYRQSLAVTPAYALFRVGVTTFWGLAVALDRSGDLEGALAQIRIARSYDPADERLRSDSWLFLPEYDRYWYEALGHWLHARELEEGLARARAYEEAVLAWSAYLQRATPDDRWLALAGRRHSQCEAEHRRRR